MAAVVEDERVVRMRFDNKVFEERIRDTIESLDKLKDRLKFKKSAEGIEELNRAAKNVNLNTIQTSVDAISAKFTALGITATTVLSNIVTDAYKTGKKMAEAITIQPVKDGLAEYETQMGAIQTILSNTRNKGSTMQDVTAALDQLNTYADKTIYNFTQMTRNIGTFTAAGVGLNASTQAIKGISNLAAVSGSNAQQASTAMYQLSQALASGTVKLMDWNSVVNAGMGGEVFQEALKRTARNMGIQVDKMIEKAGSFRESLSKGWLTSNVLIQTLAQIAGAYDEAGLKAQGYTDEQVKEILDLAQNAEDAATKVKTFTQLIDTVKEALGSGWTKSFEYIFGNFEQAEETFTKISDALGMIIAISADSRNALLSDWSSKGGREDLVSGLINLFWDLAAVVLTVRRAFYQVFPPATSNTLLAITKGFRALTIDLMMNQSTVDSLVGALKGVFSVLKFGLRIVSSVAKALSPVVKSITNFASGILAVVGYLGELLSSFLETIDTSKLVDAAFEKIQNAALLLVGILASVAMKVVEFISTIGNLAKTNDTVKSVVAAFSSLYQFVVSGLQAAIVTVSNFISTIDGTSVATFIINSLSEALNVLIGIVSVVGGIVIGTFKAFATVIKSLKNAPNIFVGISNSVKNLFNMIRESLQHNNITKIFDNAKVAFGSLKDSISEFVDKVNSKLSTLDTKTMLAMAFGASLTLLVLSLSRLAKSASAAVDSVTGTFSGLQKTLTSIKKTFDDFGKKLKTSTLFQAAMAIGVLVASVIMLSKIPFNELRNGTGAVLSLVLAFSLLTKLASKIGPANVALTINSKAMLAVAASVLVLTAAMAMLGKVTVSQDWLKQLGMITVLLGEVVGWSMLMGHFTPQLSKGGLILLAFAVSIDKVAKTIANMSSIDAAQISSNFLAIGEAVALLGALSLAASKVKFSNGAALVLVVGSLVAMEKILQGFTSEPIDRQKLLNQIGTLIAVFGTLGVLTLLSAKFGSVELGKNALKLAAGVVLLTTDIFIIAKALEKISTIDNTVFENSKETLKGIMAAIAVMTVYLGLMSSSFENTSMKLDLGKNALKLAAGVAVMTVTMRAMASLIDVLGNMDPSVLKQGLLSMTGLGLIVSAMVGVTALTKDAKIGPILSMIAAVGAIVGSLVVLTLFDADKLIGGAVAIGIALAGLGAAFFGLGKMKNASSIKETVLTVIEIVTLLGGSTHALIQLSEIPWDTLIASAVSLGGVMLAIAGAMRIAQGTALTDAAAMAIVVASSVGAAFSLSMLAEIPWEQLVAAAGSLSVTMVALALAAKLANNSVTGAASMALMSASVIALAYAFQVLSDVEFEKLVPNLIALGGAVAVLSVLGAIAAGFPPFAVGLIAVAGAFTLFSAGAALFGVGAALVGKAVNSVVTALERLAEIGPEKVSNIQNVIITSITSIGTGIGQAISQIITNVAIAVSTGIVFISTAIVSGISVIGSSVPTLLYQCGHDAIAGLLNGVSDGLGSVLGAGLSIGEMVIQGLRESLDWHSPSGITLIAGADSIAGFVLGVADNLSKAEGAGTILGNTFSEAVNSTDTSSSGISLVDGLLDGIKTAAPNIYNAGVKLGGVFNSAFGKTVKGSGEYALANPNKGKQVPELSLNSNPKQRADADIKQKLAEKKNNNVFETISAGAESAKKNNLIQDLIDSVKEPINDAIDTIDLGDLGDFSSGMNNAADASKKSGSASKENAQDKETEAKYIKYVTETAKVYSETYDEINTKLGLSTGVEAAKSAVERFAKAMVGASEATGNSSDGIAEYKKQFVELYESVSSAITGLDKFGTLSRSLTNTLSKTYVKNLNDNSKAITNWSSALSVLAQKGFSVDIIKKIVNDGVSDTSMFNDLLRASSEEVEAINNGYIEIQNQASITANAAMSAMTAAAEQAAARKRMHDEALVASQNAEEAISETNDQTVKNTEEATKAIETQTTFVEQLYTDMARALESTIESQMGVFDKFNRDCDSTKEEILGNMSSQVAGVQAWADDLTDLANRSNLSDALLEHLRSLGQNGYGYVHEFTRMSDEELSSASYYYSRMQELPKETAIKVANAMGDLRGAFNVTIEDSVSKSATEAGENLSQGFANGVDPTAANSKVIELGNNSINTLLTTLDEHSPSKITEDIGNNFALGLVNGIIECTPTVLDAVKDLGESMISEICEVLDINSPSKEMAIVGKWSDKGLAKGLVNGIHFVTDSAKMVGQNLLNSAKAGVESFLSMDFTKEITPQIVPVMNTAQFRPVRSYQNLNTTDGYTRSMISSINALKDQKNSGTIVNRVRVDNSEVVDAITELRRDIDGLKDSMSNLKVVMDTGATVGALAPGIDRELGKRNIMAGRGN